MPLCRAEEAETPVVKPVLGGLAFLDCAERADVHADLRARRWLVVSAPSDAPTPGSLRRVIDDAVEGALATRGALPPAVDVEASLDVIVRDQVFRTRALGATGLALTFPPLHEAAAPSALDPRDSAVLTAWISASQRWPVQLLLDEANRDTELLMPRRLGDLATARAPLRLAPVEHREAAPVAAPETIIPPSGEVLRAEPLDLAAEVDPPTQRIPRPPPPIIAIPRRGVLKKRSRSEAPPPDAAIEPVVIAAAPALGFDAPPETLHEAAPAAVIEPSPTLTIEVTIEAAPAPAEAIEAAPMAKIEPAPAAVRAAAPTLTLATTPRVQRAGSPRVPRSAPVVTIEPAPALGLDIEAAAMDLSLDIDVTLDLGGAPAPMTQAAPAPRPAPAQRVVNAAEWRAHAVELDKARGPKPVSVIDKLFSSRYMPLIGAIARGEVDVAVKSVADTWRMNFEHSYREAFSALRVTGKRPPMVFDAPDLAARIGRLNGARVVKLLLVDAMRFDIGERVAQLLTERLAGRAVCVERMLLWSAIPTTTATQAALIARGPEGLRDVDPAHEPDPEIVRGRAVATVRRERLGPREVMKLDLVEARLRGAGAAYDERLEAIAEEVAQVTVRYIESLPPRTLLFLFGDHGFRLPSSPDGRTTGPAVQGGVSPEEVLVPGQAWLVGGVH